MGQNLCPSIGEDQRQFVGEPFPVVEDPRSVFFLFFPVVGKLHRTPVRDVAIFSFAEHPIEHSRSAEEAHVSAMERCERSSPDVSLLGEKKTTGLAVGG